MNDATYCTRFRRFPRSLLLTSTIAVLWSFWPAAFAQSVDPDAAAADDHADGRGILIEGRNHDQRASHDADEMSFSDLDTATRKLSQPAVPAEQVRQTIAANCPPGCTNADDDSAGRLVLACSRLSLRKSFKSNTSLAADGTELDSVYAVMKERAVDLGVRGRKGGASSPIARRGESTPSSRRY